MDVELQNLINEVRESLGIDPKDNSFKVRAGQEVLRHILLMRAINQWFEVGLEKITPMLDYVLKDKAAAKAFNASNASVTKSLMGNISPQQQPQADDTIALDQEEPEPVLDSEDTTWFWKFLDAESSEVVDGI